MNSQQDLLLDLEKEKNIKPKSYFAIAYLNVIFLIAFFIINSLVLNEKTGVYKLELNFLPSFFKIILFPIISYILFLFRYKIGWILLTIISTYFCALAIAVVITKYIKFEETNAINPSGKIIFFFTSINVFLLLTSSCRNYFKISKKVLLITTLLPLLTALFVAIFYFL